MDSEESDPDANAPVGDMQERGVAGPGASAFFKLGCHGDPVFRMAVRMYGSTALSMTPRPWHPRFPV